ncbi:MAG: DUF2868 domain-containing protein [Burkholderiaceae bacterium]
MELKYGARSAGIDEAAARRIAAVRVCETELAAKLHWTEDAAQGVTRAAAQEVGEAARPERFLQRRAELAWQTMVERTPLLARALTRRRVPGWTVWALLILVFLIGMTVDRLAGHEQRINLLAPPPLLLIAWNLMVYAALGLAALRSCLRGKPAHPPGPAGWGTGGSRWWPWRRTAPAWLMPLVLDWARVSAPLARLRLARLMHAAALALGLGVVGSIALRGLGTHYIAGWESTWLSGHPDLVHGIVTSFYGWLPAGGAPLPDAAAIARMEFIPGVVPASDAPAGPWLWRIILSVLLIVVVPRAVLAALAQWRLRRLERDFPLELNTPYFDHLIRSLRGDDLSVLILPYSYRPEAAAARVLSQAAAAVAGAKGALREAAVVTQGSEETRLAAELAAGEVDLCLVVFALTATPETEVHGRFLARLREHPCAPRRLLAVLDESGFVCRFGAADARLPQRHRLWADFLSAAATPYVMVDLERRDAGFVARALEGLTPAGSQS